MPTSLRVAIYARVSISDQNPEAQLVALREFAARRGFVIHREYVHRVSGEVTRRRRRAPEFERLMADARCRHFDCVLVCADRQRIGDPQSHGEPSTHR